MQTGVAEQLMVMLESSSSEVRAVACACLGDLAASHPPLQPYLIQVHLPPSHPSDCNAATSECCLRVEEQGHHACPK